MKKLKLINAIRETIIDLKENRKHYQWTDSTNCNCGMLATNLGVNPNEMQSIGLWRNECKSTGENLKSVFSKLSDVGLTQKDIMELEYCGNEEICKEANIERMLCKGKLWVGMKFKDKQREVSQIYSSREGLIAYLEAWLRILERENKTTIPEPLPASEITFTKFEKMAEVQKLLYSN